MHVFLIEMFHNFRPFIKYVATVSATQVNFSGLYWTISSDMEPHFLECAASITTHVTNDGEEKLTRILDLFHRS